MNRSITGLHHVTAIASDPQRTLDFYVGLLGLRFVKHAVASSRDIVGSYFLSGHGAVGSGDSAKSFFPRGVDRRRKIRSDCPRIRNETIG